jgi:hypothetical protein
MGLSEINSPGRSGARLLGAKYFASEVSPVNQDHHRHRYTPENVVCVHGLKRNYGSLRLRLTLLNVAVAFKSISKSNFELPAVGTASDASQT